jgi:iron(III) transport system ATP-binding protein
MVGPPPSGQVFIGDEDVARLPPWRRNVGTVFQNYALWPHLSVRRNVAFGLEQRRLPAAEIRRRVAGALEVVGRAEYAERRPSQLSGGQQQRVALARTIVVEPRVLLLDEPLSNLDANLRIHMRREIRELQRRLGSTTVFVTHDQEEANTIADRMAVLNDGILQQVGSPMALYDNPNNRFVASFLGTANLLDGEVVEQAGQTLFHARAGLEIPLPEPVDGAAQGTAMFRPQNLASVDEGREAQAHAVRFSGRVQHREFLGNLIRYAIALNGQDILVDDRHEVGRRSYDVGDSVTVALEPAQVRFLAS